MAMTTLQDFVNPISTSQDTKKRLQLGSDLLAYLENPINTIECEEMGALIDGLVSWLKSSNFKVAQNGLETLIILSDKIKDEFRPYISTVLPASVDRLGDSKDQVRALSKSLLLKLMNPVSSPQYIFEKLAPSFSHKNFRIRDEMMLLLKDTLIRHGSQALSISKLMPQIVILLGDPNSQVRDTAILTLVEIYKHVGEAVRKDLSKKYSIAGPKLQILFQKFDEVRNNGEILPSASVEMGHRGGDEVDSKSQPIRAVTVKRVSSAPPTRRNVFTTPKPSTTTTSAGAADEEMFIRAFTDVPRIQLYSSKELEQELTKIRETLSDSNCDWEKRVEALKRVRSVMIAGGVEYDELYPNLRLLEPPFQLSVKDLRSQVVREACISIAYLAQLLGSKLDRFAESLLPHLINLIPNSAKIMSSAGTVAVRFIIQHTHVNRLIPIIAYNLSSKSKDIRKSCSEFLDQLLHTWPTHTLEKHVALLQDAIKKGISDADPEARAFSRKAYWGFADHFREQADSLLNSLDSSKQRMLQGELSMSNSSSNNSLNSAGRPFRSSASSHGGSTENLSSGRLLAGMTSGRGRSGIPVYNSKGEQIRPNPYTMRSNSAIDVGAVRRAKIRAGGLNPLLNLPRGSGASLPRMGIRKHSENTVSAITSPERISRSRARGVSHSQPSSRSGSPSSRLSYATYQMQSPDGSTPGRVRRRSGIPTAGGASRDGSPTRTGFDRRLSSGSVHNRGAAGDHVISSSAVSPVPILAERILPGNKEAEDAVADALVSNWHRLPARKRYNAFDDQSDESETSSVCSDRSFGSFGGRCVDDVADIIHCLKSVQWGDRKEGLLGLQALLRSNRMLTTPELKMITDIFSRLFMDPHMKVFTLFLDTLNELIIVHKGDLRGWLFPLITRILLKLGGDILPSLQSKIQQTLDLVRDSFPPDDQFKVITRFLNDQTQTPNQRVKISLLQYLHNLLQVMDSCDFSSNDPDTKIAVSKIIAWTADPKGTDLKKPAQDVIVDLFNLNSPEFSILLNQMSKVFQDSAFRLLRRRNSSDSSSSLGGLKSPPSPVMSIHSPNTTLTRTRSRSGSSQNSSFEMDDTENQIPEDYYNTLRKTSAEIQKYSQDSLDQDIYGKDALMRKLGDANSPHQDMGMGQNSVVDGKLDTLEERFEISSNDSSPIKRGMEYQNTRNAFNMQSLEEALFEAEMDIAEDFPISGSDSKFRSIMIELNNHDIRNEQRKVALTQLLRLAKDGSEADWDEHFREVLRLLNDTIGDSDGSIRALALTALSELMQRQTHRFHGFIEMTVLKILEAQKDADRDVVKAAETCSAVAATCLPPEHCVRTLKSIIMSDAYGYSVHQAAIKMITKVVEHPRNIVIQLLPDIMPALIQAYDHTESCVRKAAVFCMVDIYVKVGEVMKEHLVGLNSSKMKLLSVYIKRAQSNMSDGR